MARMMAEVVNFPSSKNYSINPSMTDPPALLASSPDARNIIVELEHEIADLNQHIAFQSRTLGKFNPLRAKTRLALAVLTAFMIGYAMDPPCWVHQLFGYPCPEQVAHHGPDWEPKQTTRAWMVSPKADI